MRVSLTGMYNIIYVIVEFVWLSCTDLKLNNGQSKGKGPVLAYMMNTCSGALYNLGSDS